MSRGFTPKACGARCADRGVFWLSILLIGMASCIPNGLFAADSPTTPSLPRQHSEQSFQELSRHEGHPSPLRSDVPQRNAGNPLGGSPSDDYLRGIGEGDLSKGRITCQRVAELAARTDLAKQIRVRVTEHAVDRVRERMGRTTEQEIEVVREEMVSELLRDVRITDRRFDESAGTCSSVAVMPKSRINPDGESDPHAQPAPTALPRQ